MGLFVLGSNSVLVGSQTASANKICACSQNDIIYLMHNHEPEGYQCPLCIFAQGGETEYNKRNDVVYENDDILAFISPKWWPKNPGNVMVVPKQHAENIYDIDEWLLSEVYRVGKHIAHAMKESYGCDGISFRQHNEPAGGQDLWHFHLHVFPRWKNDELYARHAEHQFVTKEERALYTEKLKERLKSN